MNEQKDWTTSTRTRSIAYWVTTVLIAVGDGVETVVAPIIFTCLVVASWALRPSSRRLPRTKT